MRFVWSIAWPGGVIMAGALAASRIPAAYEWVQGVYPIYLYLLLFFWFLIAWRFRNLKALLLLTSAVLFWGVVTSGEATGLGPDSILRKLAVVLLPANIFWISLLPERRLHPSRHLALLLIVPVQAAAILALTHMNPAQLAGWIERSHLLSILVPAAGALPWSLPLLIVLTRFILEREPLDGGCFWAYGAIWGAASALDVPERSAYFLATATLILIVSLLEKSYRLAYRDELTGLPTRRAMDDYMKSLGSMYTVAMVDVDHFKKVNDRHGHDVGDQVLRMVGAKLLAVKRPARAFRYGGEEFAVLFPGRARSETIEQLESLREEIGASPFQLRGTNRSGRKPRKSTGKKKSNASKRLYVTVSIGVADSGGGGRTSEEVFKAADTALYRAKKAGRNCLKAGKR